MTTIAQKTVFYVSHIEKLPCHFCFSRGCFVFGNDTQHHASRGTQQIVARLSWLPRMILMSAPFDLINTNKCGTLYREVHINHYYASLKFNGH